MECRQGRYQLLTSYVMVARVTGISCHGVSVPFWRNVWRSCARADSLSRVLSGHGRCGKGSRLRLSQNCVYLGWVPS